MSQSRRTFLSIVAASVAIGAAILTFGVQDGGPLSQFLPGDPPVKISIASSVTKQKWLVAARDGFLLAEPETADGRQIEIEITSVLSGDSMLQIADGTLQPTVWSPGEMAWVEQLDARWNRAHPQPIGSAACAPTVLTPVGLAMWRPMAEALGWPQKPVALKALIDLANDPDGWASVGHPEWGRLRLGHTHPQYSSAGLLFLTSAIYATSGKSEGITAQDIYSPEVEAALRALAQNTARYGMITTDLLTSMAKNGPEFLHVTSAFEEGTLRFNQDHAAELRWPLAFIFPQEGTFWSDHPFCILDGSGWVAPEQAEAANMFLDHLLSAPVQASAGEFFVRPLDSTVPLGDKLTLDHGTDPKASPATVPAFAIPSPAVSEAIIDQFQQTKRKATVMLALDVSGSMQGEPIKTATVATAEFLDRLDPADRVGLVIFNGDVTVVSPIRPVADVSETLRHQVLALPAGGGTNMNGAVCDAAAMLAAAQQADRDAAEHRLYGLVLLSDGKDSVGAISENKMLTTCLSVGSETEGAKIFAISFGGATDQDVLHRLAAETRGGVYSADAGSIRAAYLKISAEQ